jgi:hypothetical protein
MKLPLNSLYQTMLLMLIAPIALLAQEPVLRCDPPALTLSHLSRSQRQEFTRSQELFTAARYTEALDKLRALLDQLPEDTPEQYIITVKTAEAALEAGERSYAIELLKPLQTSSGFDCPALSILARAYNELHRDKERDAAIAALFALHTQDYVTTAGKLDGFLIEQQPLKGGGKLLIWYDLKPLGPHNTQIFAQVHDTKGVNLLTIEIDSDDVDQIDFRQTHPDLAAKGQRRYSLETYMQDPAQPGEQVRTTRSHIQFFDGFPPYNYIRDRILAIATRTSAPAHK